MCDTVYMAPISLVLLGAEHQVVARNMAFDLERFRELLHRPCLSFGVTRHATRPIRTGDQSSLPVIGNTVEIRRAVRMPILPSLSID